jgi:hypothetical protein
VICPMCRPTRNELPWVVCCAVSAVGLPAVMAALAFLFVPSGGWSFFWSFFWSFLVGGLFFGGVYWMVFLLVVPGGWSLFWWRLLDGLSFGRFWWMVCRVYN